MNTIPLVSIVVPIYKVPEKFLRKCIESLLEQSLENIEIILVDDGSPDKCGEICDYYAAKDCKIKVIHKKHAGLSVARNTGFDAATGECITFVDGDDFLETDTCELGYKTLKENNVQMVFWNRIDEYNNSSQEIKTYGNKNILFRDEACKELQARVLNFNGNISQVFSKMIRRDYLIRYNIRHIDYLKQGAEGIVFNMFLFEHVKSAYYLSKSLYHHVYNNQSISHTSNEQNCYLVVRCFEYIAKYIKSSSNRIELEKNLYNRLLCVIVTTGITGYFNPSNKSSYDEKVIGYKKFLQEPLIVEAMKKANYEGVSFKRKVILTLVKLKQFWILCILGKIHGIQLENK